MAERGSSASSATEESSPREAPTLLQTAKKKKKGDKGAKALRILSSVFRSFPIVGPKCTLSALSGRLAGTLFGRRKARAALSLQDTPTAMPTRLIELPILTHLLLKEMGSGSVRMALECEKKPDKTRELLDEPVWNVFFNGKKMGCGMRREAKEEDIRVMEHLRGVSMGGGVLPSGDGDGEIAYLRSSFDHVVGSRDSETLYMISPHGNSGPDLTLFFVRI